MTAINHSVQASGHDASTNYNVLPGTQLPKYNTAMIIGEVGANHSHGIIMFSGLPIPQGSTINSATLNLATAGGNVPLDTFRFEIRAHDTDSSYELNTIGDYQALPKTTAVSYFHHTFSSFTSSGTPFSQTVQPVIQSIISRSGWTYGNNLALIISPSGTPTLTGSHFETFITYDWTRSSSYYSTPYLSIDYTAPAIAISSGLNLFIGNQCIDVLKPSGTYLVNSSGKFTNSNGNTSDLWDYVNEFTTDLLDTNYLQITQSGTINKPEFLYYVGSDSGNTKYNIVRHRLSDHTKKEFQRTFSPTALCIDPTTDYLYHSSDSGAYYELKNYRTDYTEPYASVPMFTLDDNTIIGSVNTVLDIDIDLINRKIYFINDNNTNTTIYSCDTNGSNILSLVSETRPDKIYALKWDQKNSRLHYVKGNVNGTFGSPVIHTVSDSGGLTYNTNYFYTLPTGEDLNGISHDIDVDYINENVYISSEKYYSTYGPQIVKYSGLSTLVSGAIVASGDYFAIDPRNNKLYYNYINPSIPSDRGKLQSTNLTGSAHTFISSGNFSSFSIDRDVYKQFIEFNLTDPTSSAGASELQMYSDGYIRMLGETQPSSQIEYTGVTAKIISSSGLSWRPNGAEVLLFGSGSQSKNLGLNTSEINYQFNSRSHWNNAILHLDFSSINTLQSSGVFKNYSTEVIMSCSGNYYSTGATSGINLYTSGKSLSSGNLPLYILSNTPSSGINLFERGHSLSSGLIRLSISGGYPNETLPLYIKSQISTSGTKSLNLFTRGASSSGISNSMPLYVKILNYMENSGVLPLYTHGYGNFYSSGNLPIYMFGQIPNVNNSINLFLNNTGFGSGVNLYIKGRGFSGEPGYLDSDGGIPTYASIPLYMRRVDENNVMTMFIQCQIQSGVLPLYVGGSNPLGSGLNLVMPNTQSNQTVNKHLYTHGY